MEAMALAETNRRHILTSLTAPQLNNNPGAALECGHANPEFPFWNPGELQVYTGKAGVREQ
jgi:hypothetical protein